MLIIGLTGGIGSGKSTVANLFAEYNIPVIDTDVIARTLTTPEASPFPVIVEHFGPSILTKEHALNRKLLREKIFTDEKERKWLENLLHPLIGEEVEKKLTTLSAPYCLIIIPLLFETIPYPFIKRYLIIDAPIELQIERVMRRDQLSKAQVESILKTQVTREHRLKKAHDVIINDGILADLIPQVEKMHHLYLSISKK